VYIEDEIIDLELSIVARATEFARAAVKALKFHCILVLNNQ